ncbi:MAG: transcriptional repressor [Muribaculaceae bacterium]|nr:transcriptional repressor [Muribaculaceae bacterium]MBQ7204582.1 transcriptional repressor [Muribaculaceae bacterium]
MKTDPNIDDFVDSNNPAVRKFNDYLDAHGMRRTTERYAILNRILGINGHFTIEELQQMIEGDGFRVSRSTVYNTVELLIEAKMLRRHVFEGMQAQYERITLPHTHLICTTCGKVKEVRDPNFAAFMNARRFNAFNTDHYSLYVYGTCSTCARKSKRTQAQLEEKIIKRK